MTLKRTFICGFAWAALLPLSHAATRTVELNVLNSTTTLATPFLPGDNLLFDALVTSSTGALTETVNFTVGAGVTSVTGSAAWEITTATSEGPRLVGVNIDIFDANNTLVASDTSVQVLGGFALSSLSAALAPGAYRLVATGTGVRTSSLDINLSFAGASEGLVAAATLPVTVGVLNSSITMATPLVAGDTLFVDALVTGDTGALSQATHFTVGAGVTGFTSEAAWAVTPVSGTGPRLIGVDISLLDSSNTVIFTDALAGLANSWAVSSFGGSLAPGAYTLLATGTAVRDTSLNMSFTLLSSGPSQVPEPSALMLMLFGLVGLGFSRRKR